MGAGQRREGRGRRRNERPAVGMRIEPKRGRCESLTLDDLLLACLQRGKRAGGIWTSRSAAAQEVQVAVASPAIASDRRQADGWDPSLPVFVTLRIPVPSNRNGRWQRTSRRLPRCNGRCGSGERGRESRKQRKEEDGRRTKNKRRCERERCALGPAYRDDETGRFAGFCFVKRRQHLGTSAGPETRSLISGNLERALSHLWGTDKAADHRTLFWILPGEEGVGSPLSQARRPNSAIHDRPRSHFRHSAILRRWRDSNAVSRYPTLLGCLEATYG